MKKSIIDNLNSPIIAMSVFLALWGSLAVFNVTFVREEHYFFALKQIVWIFFALIILLISANLDSEFYFRFKYYFFSVFFVLLWGVLFFGIAINGMRGWYSFEGHILMQPSELSKPIFILCIASFLTSSDYKTKISKIKEYFIYLFIGLLWIVPVLLQPDYGTALVYIISLFLLYWCLGGRISFLAISMLLAGVFFIFVVANEPYVLDRLRGFISPTEHSATSGWHILQYQNTLARGGFVGQDWGANLWSQVYLPNPYSDSIFASIGEALGFLGLLPIFAVIAVWMSWGFLKATQLDDLRRSAVVYGLVGMLVIQAMLHISVTVGIFPPTGVTLPMFSYGGSSLSATMFSIGMTVSMLRDGCKYTLDRPCTKRF
ncbi:MAG: FtsW/RodA/SpoVE family cell cycle protein [Verrucomicrobiota bacterium]|nr:FtsW/RodA/SpoVE family cell cycle protein [Verrucomicrobiota bacterium]